MIFVWLLCAVPATIGALCCLARLGFSAVENYRAYNALTALNEEIARAQGRSHERYRGPMLNARPYDDELANCLSVADSLEQNLLRLWRPRFGEILSKSWQQDCREVATRAHNAIRSLQRAAFWAQQPGGREF